MPPKFFLTTPIYYVNARPHIGHAYTTLVADVLARRSRAEGVDTWFLTGTDEHGQKIERSAAVAGIPPQQFADAVSAQFKQLWDRMGLTYDQYIRTTDPAHKRGVQVLWEELQSRGHIYLSAYTGQYCVSEEIFVEGPPGTLGPDGRPTETVTEENYFFRLSSFQLPLLDLIESDTLEIRPETRKNELLSFLRGPVSSVTESSVGPTDLGPSPSREPEPNSPAPLTLDSSAAGNPYVVGALRDLSISRSSFTWGIPVPGRQPGEAAHVIYVWLDALANYMTAVGYGDPSPEAQANFAKYWPADLHLVGKEIIRQHCIYWPAFLLALNPALAHAPHEPTPDLPFEDHRRWAEHMLPKKVVAHGWLLFEESKMSKSRGNIVRTETILEAFGSLCPPPPTPLASIAPQAPNAPPAPAPAPVVPQPPEASPAPAAPPAPEASLKGTASAVPQTPANGSAALAAEVRTPSVAPPAPEASLKGTASAVPQTPANGSAALAAEVRTPSIAPQAPEALLKGTASAVPHRCADESAASAAEVRTPSVASPAPEASLKGTASAVPQTPANSAALAAEVRTPFAAPQTAVIRSEANNPPIQSEAAEPVIQSEAKDPHKSQPTTNPPTLSPTEPPSSPTPHHRDLFAADVLRYFLLREIPFGQDGSFSFDALITRYNADLANGYGNLVSRTLKMIADNFSSQIPPRFVDTTFAANFEPFLYLPQNLNGAMYKLYEKLNFSRDLEVLMEYVAFTDSLLTREKPWEKAKVIRTLDNKAEAADQLKNEMSATLYTAAESIRIITALLHPILPYATASVWRQLGLGDIEQAAQNGDLTNLQWGGLHPGTKLGPLSPIFPRADKGLAKIMADMEHQAAENKNTLATVTSQADAATPTTSPFPEAPIASELAPNPGTFPPPDALDPTDPAAPPRTSTFAEPNPGLQVAASAAATTEREGTPPHTEAQASGIFSTSSQQAGTPQITIEDFAKVELRVAKVVVAERIPKADKLLRLEVDLGDERRQILSGIAEWYTPEDLLGRRIVVITNLAPRKMRGLESHGMLLAASAPPVPGEKPGKPALATFADTDDLPLGARLK